LTERCVDSLLEQTPALTIVVVDNDGGWSAGHRAGVDVLRTDRNRGYTGGMNLGLKWALARGYDYIVLVTNDGWLEDPHGISALVDDLDMTDRLGACGPALLRRAADGSLKPFAIAANSYPRSAPEGALSRPVTLPPSMKGVPWIGGSCLALKADAVTDVGLLDESLFMYVEEVEWCFRARMRGWFLAVDERVSFCEDASASSSTVPGLKDYYTTRNRLIVLRRHGSAKDLVYAGVRAARLTIGLARRRDPSWRWVAMGAIDFLRGQTGMNPTIHSRAGSGQ
jgi:GT2 family glycosyltransferase